MKTQSKELLRPYFYHADVVWDPCMADVYYLASEVDILLKKLDSEIEELKNTYKQENK